MADRESLFSVQVTAKLHKFGKHCIFEIQVFDDNGVDITDMFRFYAKLTEKDIGAKDVIDAVITKKTN
ncbi:hypothetical protein [Caballeronia zhejiangensis]|uniref:hypothetical protein n=1 Tax=Caballeronia zhejiangensis TaxID=871203 RepID=UPI001F52A0D8|nr:hypothetical protein [Caballeronia zhejiangensis]MCI1046949.1 hypothetical protein [Caballeronia zhejiangensis]